MPGKHFSAEERARIAQAALTTPCRTVAAQFGCSKSSVDRWTQQYRQTGSNASPPSAGRTPRFDERSLSRIRRIFVQNRRQTPLQLLPILESHGFSLSLSSLRRLMKLFGFKRRIARVKPLLDNRARRLRRNYASGHLNDDLNDWRRTIFADEASVQSNGTIKSWVTRREGEAMLEDCVAVKLFSGRYSMMVWGAIWYGGRSKLVRFDTSKSKSKRKGVNGEIYAEQIVKSELKKCWNRVNNSWRAFGGARILEDNAPIHLAEEARQAGLRQRFKYLDFPPSSPDLNPIENCWAILKRRLAQLPKRPTNHGMLFEVISKLWDELPQDIIDRTIDSMPRRLRMVKEAHGFATKY